MRRGTLRLTFIPAGPDGDAALAWALTEFARIAPSLGTRTSLVCFFEHDARLRDLGDYRRDFWRRLQSLHERDTGPWPEDVDVDPESPTWEFSFAGTAFFVVANTPVHGLRRSRQLEYFAITFQPRFVFDDLGAETRKGANARRIIRRRVRVYDKLAPAPTLGSFGEDGNKEWQQYFLEDHNEPPDPTSRNPFRTCPHRCWRTSMTDPHHLRLT